MATALSFFLSYRTYRQATMESARTNLQTASEHLENGWPSAAVELGQFGPEGLRVLVTSVDSTHRTVQKSWPMVTRAALQEIYRKRDSITEDERQILLTAMRD